MKTPICRTPIDFGGLTRRHFLKISGLTLGAFVVKDSFCWGIESADDVLISGVWYRDPQLGPVSKIAILYLKSDRLVHVDSPIKNPHCILQNYNNPNYLLVIGKYDNRLCNIDFLTGKKVSEVTLLPGRKLGGHGCYSKDGKAIFISENYGREENGIVTVRDSTTLKEIGSFSSGGGFPHDLALMPDGVSLAVANAGHQSKDISHGGGLAVIDTISGKIIDSMPSQNKFGVTHLAISQAGRLFGAGLAFKGLSKQEMSRAKAEHKNENDYVPDVTSAPIFTREVDKNYGSIQSPQIWDQMSHPQSITIDERGSTLGVTFNSGRMVAFWDLKSGNLKKSFNFDRGPHGLILSKNKENFIVHTSDGEIFFFDSKTLEPNRKSFRPKFFEPGKTGFTSAHIYQLKSTHVI